jgi:hypothetical protein
MTFKNRWGITDIVIEQQGIDKNSNWDNYHG